MKILLVNAPVIRYNDKFKNIEFFLFWKNFFKRFGQFRYGVRAGSRWPWTHTAPTVGSPHFPFIMSYCAALLKENGCMVNIIDSVASEIYSYKKFFTQVKSENADIVIIECSTPTIDIDLWIAKEISNFTDVALAGSHLTDEITPKTKEENPHIKYFLKGEYILSALEMAKTKREGVYEGEVVGDLDKIPFPFRDYNDSEKYFEPSMPTPKPQLQMYASKGCPFRCKFCLWPQVMYKGKVSFRSPKLVAEEIRENIAKNGYKSILFDDDTFNVQTDRISELCDYLKEIGLPWTMMGRLDCSPDWLYDKMVDCGCVGMRFGLETFDIDILKGISKGLERTDFKKTLEYITNKYPKIWIHLTMMKNMPGQTEEIHKEDMSILSEMGYSTGNIHRSYQLATCAPFPGTKLYEEMVALKGADAMSDFSKYDGGKDTIMSEPQ